MFVCISFPYITAENSNNLRESNQLLTFFLSDASEKHIQYEHVETCHSTLYNFSLVCGQSQFNGTFD